MFHSSFFRATETPSSTTRCCRGYQRGCSLVKIRLANGSIDSEAIVMGFPSLRGPDFAELTYPRSESCEDANRCVKLRWPTSEPGSCDDVSENKRYVRLKSRCSHSGKRRDRWSTSLFLMDVLPGRGERRSKLKINQITVLEKRQSARTYPVVGMFADT